jgi:hypothetical protein
MLHRRTVTSVNVRTGQYYVGSQVFESCTSPYAWSCSISVLCSIVVKHAVLLVLHIRSGEPHRANPTSPDNFGIAEQVANTMLETLLLLFNQVLKLMQSMLHNVE